MKSVDLEKAIEASKKMFESLELNVLEETPARFVKMIRDMTLYNNTSNSEIADMVNKIFPLNLQPHSKNVVIVKNIDAFSLCEHHVALMYDMKVSVAYIPTEFVLGLSKIVRMVDMVCKRLQLQERISSDILEIMKILTKTEDVAVMIKAKHSCVTARGINNISSETVTTCFSGKFESDINTRVEFLNSLDK
ncbi:MAG: GTP cyclohydrolase I [Acutalibacteraceae bacterium]